MVLTSIHVPFSKITFCKGSRVEWTSQVILKIWSLAQSCFMLLGLNCIILRAKLLINVPTFMFLIQKSLFSEVSLTLQPTITHQREVHKISPGHSCSSADTTLRSCVMTSTRTQPKGRNENFKQVVFFFASYYLHGVCEPCGLTSGGEPSNQVSQKTPAKEEILAKT